MRGFSRCIAGWPDEYSRVPTTSLSSFWVARFLSLARGISQTLSLHPRAVAASTLPPAHEVTTPSPSYPNPSKRNARPFSFSSGSQCDAVWGPPSARATLDVYPVGITLRFLILPEDFYALVNPACEQSSPWIHLTLRTAAIDESSFNVLCPEAPNKIGFSLIRGEC